MRNRVFDCHCDTAYELWKGQLEIAESNLQIDLNRTQNLESYAQFFAFWTYPGMEDPQGVFSGMLRTMKDQLSRHGDMVAQAKTPKQAAEIVSNGKVAAIFSLEGPAGIGFDASRLDDLYQEGFRMTTLTWNEENPLAGSHKTGGGLTEKGREFAKRAQKLGMILDVSHLSEQAFWNLCDLAQKPIIASHSNSRKIYGHSRNLTDEQFQAICQLKGVAGLNLYTGFLGDALVSLDNACDHVLHFLELGGEKHIALGGDLDGCESLPEGFTGPESYPKLAKALLRRGVDEEIIEDIFWNNMIRVFEECCT
jgi:membrane dipeptidase